MNYFTLSWVECGAPEIGNGAAGCIRRTPVTVLCRRCPLDDYVFEGTRVCPHCGGDARKTGERYQESGCLAIEAMQRIDRLRDA